MKRKKATAIVSGALAFGLGGALAGALLFQAASGSAAANRQSRLGQLASASTKAAEQASSAAARSLGAPVALGGGNGGVQAAARVGASRPATKLPTNPGGVTKAAGSATSPGAGKTPGRASGKSSGKGSSTSSSSTRKCLVSPKAPKGSPLHGKVKICVKAPGGSPKLPAPPKTPKPPIPTPTVPTTVPTLPPSPTVPTTLPSGV